MLSRLSLSSNLVGFDTGSELCLLSSSVFLRFFRSRYRFFLFLQHKLDVARRRHVRVDATVRSVRSSSLRDGLIDLDVRDVEIVNVQPLNLGIRFRVLEQVDQDLRALLRPSALAVRGAFLLAWAVLPTPPQNLRKTTHRSIFITEFKKPCASLKLRPLMFIAVSLMFLK